MNLSLNKHLKHRVKINAKVPYGEKEAEWYCLDCLVTFWTPSLEAIEDVIGDRIGKLESRPIDSKTCEWCKCSFPVSRKDNKVYCSISCRKSASRKRNS